MSISPDLLRKIVEAALLAAAKPLTVAQLQQLFEDDEQPSKAELMAAFEDIENDCADRGFELFEVASGWRFQVRQEYAQWVGRLWEEKPQKYSRALLETLALVAYRQPITRGEIEDVRGVAVSSNIIRTLQERHWVKVIGHRDVPGRPAMYATTRDFLDYFGMKSLEELPTLAALRDFDSLNQELNLYDDLPEEMRQAPLAPTIDDDGDASQQEDFDGFTENSSDIEADVINTEDTEVYALENSRELAELQDYSDENATKTDDIETNESKEIEL
jgi:segregation and condensation protein B